MGGCEGVEGVSGVVDEGGGEEEGFEGVGEGDRGVVEIWGFGDAAAEYGVDGADASAGVAECHVSDATAAAAKSTNDSTRF